MPSLDMLTACFSDAEFPRHHHETFVIQVVEEGADLFETTEGCHRAEVGSLVLINPYQVHTGRPAEAPLQYRAVYPSRRLMRTLAGGVLPSFRESVVEDRASVRAFIGAHRSLERDPYSKQRFGQMMAVLQELVLRHSSTAADSTSSDDPLARAKRLVTHDLARRMTLEELGDAVGFSPYHLQRSFLQRFGQTPQEFLLNARVERAKTLLKAGRQPVHVAFGLGFSDQAHFTRVFKRIVGVTPGQYCAA